MSLKKISLVICDGADVATAVVIVVADVVAVVIVEVAVASVVTDAVAVK